MGRDCDLCMQVGHLAKGTERGLCRGHKTSGKVSGSGHNYNTQQPRFQATANRFTLDLVMRLWDEPGAAVGTVVNRKRDKSRRN